MQHARANRRLLSVGLALLTLLIGVPGCGENGSDQPRPERLDQILEMRDPQARAQQLLVFLDGSTLADLPEIVDAYKQAWVSVDETATVLLATWWASQDPTGAFNEGRTVTRMSQSLWAATVVRVWARIAPAAALRAVREAYGPGTDEWNRGLTLSLARGWCDGDADAAPLMSFIRTLPDGRPKKEMLDVFLARLVHVRGPSATIEMVEAIDTPGSRGFRQDAFQRLATTLTNDDPRIAIEWADRHRAAPEGEMLYRRIARRWAQRDPAASLDWTLTWQDGEARKRAAVASYRIFLALDLDGALAWLDAQASESVVRLMYRYSVTKLVAKDRPLDAIARARAVEEPARRDSLVIAAARAWLERDRPAAEAWLADAALSPESLRRVRAPKARSRRAREEPLEPASPPAAIGEAIDQDPVAAFD